MPRIFDNIEQHLLPTLQASLKVATRADFCVGYFNLRGWKDIGPLVDDWGTDGRQCRILVGMQPTPEELLRSGLSLVQPRMMDQQQVLQLKKRMAEDFRRQLTFGAPTNTDGVKTGYEVSFTRYFYQPQPLRSLGEISADILALEQETEGLLSEIVGGVSR